MNSEQIIEQVTGELIKVLAQKGELKSSLETVEKREAELKAFIEGVKAVQQQVQAQAPDDTVTMAPKNA